MPDGSSIYLSALKKEDAHRLIKKGLIAKNYRNQDVEELAYTLQYFPLHLLPAIAHINEEHKIRSLSGGQYQIQNYLTDLKGGFNLDH